MESDAFIYTSGAEGLEFASYWLASPDFDVETLKSICHQYGLRSSAKKKFEFKDIIFPHCDNLQLRKIIIEQLLTRSRTWVSVKTGRIRKFPNCLDADELVLKMGQEKWYGPIENPSDKNPHASWYIRPVLIPHWIIPTNINEQPEKAIIRWLCFGRVSQDSISLHWKGFSHIENVESVGKHQAQFQYWEFIPKLFEEIEEMAQCRLEFPKLHKVILHDLWNQYRYDEKNYSWKDLRIRAEAGGVSLNASTIGIIEYSDEEIQGLGRLANAIRKAIETELATVFKASLPEAKRFDEVILRTLLRELGTLSYEFKLENHKETLFHAHSYFGLKQKVPSPDRFPHMKIIRSSRSDLQQLEFLLEHLRSSNARNQLEQVSLF